MKQHYTKILLFLLLFTFLIYLPGKSRAQCTTCGSGTIDSVQYSVTYSGLTGFYTFNMPMFNPVLGTLTCMKMYDTVTSQMTFRLANRVNNRFTYNINANQTTTISGPSGFSASSNYFSTFGPYDLGTANISPSPNINPPEPDTAVTVGPTSIFSNTAFSKVKTSGLGGYIGVGTIPFTFDLSGPVWPAPSSGNFGLDVQSNSNITVHLTYFFCTAAALANSITSFYAIKSGSSINLQWTGQNEQTTDNYEIQYSKDGIHFSALNKQQAYVTDSGAASKYQYQYNLAATDVVQLFFRIKKTNAAGKAGYSAVKVIKLDASGAIGNFQIYPNPASKHINLEWSSVITGKITIGVLNTVGQQLVNKSFELNGSMIQFDLPSTLGPGLYYLLVKDVSTNTQQLTKLLIH